MTDSQKRLWTFAVLGISLGVSMFIASLVHIWQGQPDVAWERTPYLIFLGLASICVLTAGTSFRKTTALSGFVGTAYGFQLLFTPRYANFVTHMFETDGEVNNMTASFAFPSLTLGLLLFTTVAILDSKKSGASNAPGAPGSVNKAE